MHLWASLWCWATSIMYVRDASKSCVVSSHPMHATSSGADAEPLALASIAVPSKSASLEAHDWAHRMWLGVLAKEGAGAAWCCTASAAVGGTGTAARFIKPRSASGTVRSSCAAMNRCCSVDMESRNLRSILSSDINPHRGSAEACGTRRRTGGRS